MKKKYKLWIGLSVLLILLGSIGYYFLAPKPAVDAFKVTKGPIIDEITETGYIEAINDAEIQSEVSGVVEAVYFEVGDVVSKGDLILIINHDVLDLQLEQLDSEINALNFQLLEAVKPADQEQIKNSTYLVQQARSNRNKAKEDYDNQRALFQSGAVSKTVLDASEKVYNDSVIAYNLAENELTLINKDVSENIESQYTSQIDALITQRKILERQLLNYEVHAPLGGTIVNESIKVGHFVNPGQLLYEVATLGDYQIETFVLEENQLQINKESLVQVFDTVNEIYYSGRIDTIYPKAETYVSDLGIRQNRIRLHVKANELKDYLLGTELDVIIQLDQANNLRVPIESVYQQDGELYVFVVSSNQLTAQKIEVGLKGEDYYEVISGLSEGMLVVKTITNELSEGLRVNTNEISD